MTEYASKRNLRPGWGLLLFSALNMLGPLMHCGARTDLGLSDLVKAASEDAGLDATSGDEPVACLPGTFALVRAEPLVLFVIDRSQSMLLPFRRGQSRWDVFVSAMATTLPNIEAASGSSLQLGALLFPAVGTSGASCTVPKALDLSPAQGNGSPLLSLLRRVHADGSTPTAAAVELAGNTLAGLRAGSSARAMILATDGAPTCNPDLDSTRCACSNGASCNGHPERCLDDLRAVSTIAGFRTRGIPTYVIGIQATEGSEFTHVLDAMADAGGRPLAGGTLAHRYYAASSEDELVSALRAIGGQVASCSFLTSSVPNESGTIRITRRGEEILYDPSEGWSWSNRANGELLLNGDTCLAADAGDLAAEVTCD